MKQTQAMDVQPLFATILKALQKENHELSQALSTCQCKPLHLYGQGVAALYERQIQYIVFKTLVEEAKCTVYLEYPYPRGKGNTKCDLIICFRNSRKQIWIEMKVWGWSEWYTDRQYKRSLGADAKKLRHLSNTNITKYLLVTSIENDEPVIHQWKKWFEHELPQVKFDPSLFGYFKTIFSNLRTFNEGYYTVSLLAVP
jgi:hypothetical protein